MRRRLNSSSSREPPSRLRRRRRQRRPGASAVWCLATTTGSRVTTCRNGKISRGSGSGGPISPTTTGSRHASPRGLRLEVNSNGDLEGGNLEPYVKDAYVQWTYAGQHAATLGIQPTATFNWLEGFWGLRHIEKAPADLYRIDSSRDLGLSFEGPFVMPAVHYVAQLGNESGTGSETDKYKAYRFEGRFDRNPGFAIEGFYGLFNRPDGEAWHTSQVFGGFRMSRWRAGLHYLHQSRSSGTAEPDTDIDIVSAFVVFDPIVQRLSLFARADWVNDPLPGADGIDYLPIDSGSPFTYFLGWSRMVSAPVPSVQPEPRGGELQGAVGARPRYGNRAPRDVLLGVVASRPDRLPGGRMAKASCGACHMTPDARVSLTSRVSARRPSAVHGSTPASATRSTASAARD